MAARPIPFFSSLLPPPGPGRTLRVAGGLLGLCAAGQLAALTWFLARGGARRPADGAGESIAAVAVPQPTPDLAPPQPTPLSVAPPAVPVPAAPPPQPPAELPPAAVAVAAAASPNLPTYVQPTPAPALSRPGGGGAAELIEQAKALRARGDTQSALARLREAQGASGSAENPLVVAEMALTFEAMQLPDRASAQWQRLYELGEIAGAPYYLAESRLRANGEMPPTAVATPDPAGTGRDRSGFQQNALLRILETRVEEQPDASVEKKIALRIVVKNRPGTAIDSRKVKVEAYYYDLLDGKEIVQTDAETGFQWLTPPVDWANDSSEVLETTYLRSKSGPLAGAASASALLPPPPPPRPAPARRNGSNRGKATPPPIPPPPAMTPEPPAGPPRVYLGYIVRLYYNRQLQDVRAEPEQLLQRFPPPLTLPAEQP